MCAVKAEIQPVVLYFQHVLLSHKKLITFDIWQQRSSRQLSREKNQQVKYRLPVEKATHLHRSRDVAACFERSMNSHKLRLSLFYRSMSETLVNTIARFKRRLKFTTCLEQAEHIKETFLQSSNDSVWSVTSACDGWLSVVNAAIWFLSCLAWRVAMHWKHRAVTIQHWIDSTVLAEPVLNLQHWAGGLPSGCIAGIDKWMIVKNVHTRFFNLCKPASAAW